MSSKKLPSVPPLPVPVPLDPAARQTLLRLPTDLVGLLHTYFEPREISSLHQLMPEWQNDSMKRYIEQGMLLYAQQCLETQIREMFGKSTTLPADGLLSDLWALLHNTQTWVDSTQVRRWLLSNRESSQAKKRICLSKKLSCEQSSCTASSCEHYYDKWKDFVRKHCHVLRAEYHISPKNREFYFSIQINEHVSPRTILFKFRFSGWHSSSGVSHSNFFDLQQEFNQHPNPFDGYLLGAPCQDKQPRLLIHPGFDLFKQTAFVHPTMKLSTADRTKMIDERRHFRLVILNADTFYESVKRKHSGAVATARILHPSEWRSPTRCTLLIDQHHPSSWISYCETIPVILQNEMKRDPSAYGRRISPRTSHCDYKWPNFFQSECKKSMCCSKGDHSFVSISRDPLSDNVPEGLLPMAINLSTGEWMTTEQISSHLHDKKPPPFPMPWTRQGVFKRQDRFHLLSQHMGVCGVKPCEKDDGNQHVEICLSCLYYQIEVFERCTCIFSFLRRPHIHRNGMTVLLE